MENETVRILAGPLSAIGLLISVYFALVFRDVLSPDTRFLPKVCRMEKSNCISILQTREARLLGISNFDLGIGYYALILLWVFTGTLLEWLLPVLKISSGFTVLIGIYLTHSLLFRIRVTCVLCLASHAANFLLFLLFNLFV